MKQSLRICLVLLIILSVLPFGALAQEADGAEQVIIDACLYNRVGNLSDYHLTETDLDDLFTRLMDTGKLPWYADTYSYSYSQSTGIVQEFTPDNLDPATFDRSVYEQKVAEVLAECVFDGMDAVQTALSIHDYLVANTIYDETLQKNSAYELLVEGSTVCVGYTELYKDLLNRCGIPCVSVTSIEMEHTWNLVNIDGQWYHVDVTWDDPTPDAYGLVDHRYFLVTDAQISAGDKPHYGWETDIACTDTRFENAYWTDVTSRICFASSEVSYLMRSADWSDTIYRRDEATGSETRLYRNNQPYVNVGRGNYTYGRRGLSLWEGKLYFGELDRVLALDPDTGKTSRVFSYSTSGGKYIQGVFVRDGVAYLTLSDHDGNTAPTTQTFAEGGHVHSYTQTVHSPTCLDAGFTASTCDCGITATGDVTPPLGHSNKKIDGKAATFFGEGFSTLQCGVCGNTETVTLPQIDLMDWLQENIVVVGTVAGGVVGGLVALVSRITRRNRKVQV